MPAWRNCVACNSRVARDTPSTYLRYLPTTRVIFPIVSTFLSKKLKSRVGLIPEVDGRVDKLFEYLPPTTVPAEVGGTAAFDMEAWAASTLN